MTESRNKPEIKRLQGKILVPYNAAQKERTDEDGNAETVWVYSLMRYPASAASAGNLPFWKKETAKQLNRELQEYIYSIYDPGVQSTISGYAARALSDGKSDIVDECRKVQDWVDSVLEYYDKKKQEILSAESEDERMGVTWDFKTDVAPDEYIDWRDVKEMFEA